jgi:hypothetical protein
MTAADNDRVTVLLDRFPGPMTLRPSFWKWLGLLVLSIAGVGGSLWLIHRAQTGSDILYAWLTMIFFALGLAVSTVMLMPGSSGLTLGKDGFVVRNLFYRQSFRWTNVGEFDVRQIRYPYGRKSFVVYTDASASGSLVAASIRLMGYTSALPETYGLPIEYLRRLMSLWRQRALDYAT